MSPRKSKETPFSPRSKKREIQKKSEAELTRLAQRLIAALCIAFVLGMASVIYIFQLRHQIRDIQSAANQRSAPVETLQGPVLSPPNAAGTVNAPLELVKVSTLKKGQVAYADLETLTSLAKGRRPSETFVSLTRPAANPTSIGNTVRGDEPFWKMVKAERGYNLIAYASAGDALSAANGEYAVVYARPIAGRRRNAHPFPKTPSLRRHPQRNHGR